jgi:hypothetical protein
MFQGSFPTTRATMRRFIALLLLLVTVAFQAEAVFGEVRDGSVHHEAVAEAWIHAHDPHGSHPHDGPQQAESSGELGDSAHEEHRPPGDATDHCTHIHGMALVHPVDVTLISTECSFELASMPQASELRFEALTPPPRS